MRTASTRAPLSEGIQPPVQWFKSVVLLLEVDATGRDFLVPTALLVDWIGRYDDWFKEAAGIDQGRRLHLVYHREVSVAGEIPLQCSSRLVEIGRSCRGRGIGFSVTVEIGQAQRWREALDEILDAGVLSSLGVNVDVNRTPDHAAADREWIESLLERGVMVGLIGAVHYFRDIGLLGSQALNRSNITVYPATAEGAENLPMPLNPARPCFSRLRVFVDSDGSLYPCLGLLRIGAASLGTVFDDLRETVLGGRESMLDLRQLAELGPELEQIASAQRQSGLPWICEMHRLRLLGALSGDPRLEAQVVGSPRTTLGG